MKIHIIIKELWKLFPFRFLITILARLFIISAVLSYLKTLGEVSLIVTAILTLWASMPLYSHFRDLYYRCLGCQTPTTLLWNSLEDSIRSLDESSKKRIIAIKQRIWVQQNPEINIFNYWILKLIRKKEWMDIDTNKEAKN